MSKVVFLRLRNRTINKFKTIKAKKAVKKVAKRAAKPNQIKKTLRVIKKVAPVAKAVPAGKASPQQKASKSPSPVSKHGSPVPKIGARTLNSIIGHRRMFLRNRRLMELAHRPMVAAF